MKPEELAKEVRAYCVAHADPANVAKYAKYFREGYDAWGVDGKDPLYQQMKDEWLARYRPLGLKGFLRAAELLFAGGKYEEISLAIFFLCSFREQEGAAMVGHMDAYFRLGINNWAHTDVLCGMLAGPMLAAGEYKMKALAPWRKSELRFQRRAVPVAMLNLLKSGAKVEPLLTFLKPMMLDEERVVQQGLGWFLREAWKLHPEPVEAFLLEWRDTAGRVIFQYATEKMTAEQKARFRRSKQAKASY